ALFGVAAAPDPGGPVRSGERGGDDGPTPRGVRAGGARRCLDAPVEINGRHFLDGALRRTMHASTVLERGIDLMIGINPLVPFDGSHAPRRPDEAGPLGLVEAGLPAVLSQTLRTLLQS